MYLTSMMRAAAVAGVLIALASLAIFGDVASFGARFDREGGLFQALGVLALLALWLASPLPVAYAIARRLASTRPAQIATLAGMVLTLAVGAWLFHGAISVRQTESLAGLVLFFAPAYQYGLLALTLMAAAFLRRWPRPPVS